MPTSFKYALLIVEVVDYDSGEVTIKLPGTDGNPVRVTIDADAAPLSEEQARELGQQFRVGPFYPGT